MNITTIFYSIFPDFTTVYSLSCGSCKCKSTTMIYLKL